MSALDLNALELCRNCTVNVKHIKMYKKFKWTYIYVCQSTRSSDEHTYMSVSLQEVQMNIHICLSVCTRSSDEHTYMSVSLILVCFLLDAMNNDTYSNVALFIQIWFKKYFMSGRTKIFNSVTIKPFERKLGWNVPCVVVYKFSFNFWWLDIQDGCHCRT